MSESTHYLVYTSRITPKASFQTNTFTDILAKSNHNNNMANISGFLFFKKGKFLQYIEGNHQAIISLYEKLEQDKRHKALKIIVSGTRPAPIFGQWAMHCIDLGNSESGVFSELAEDFAPYQWGAREALQLISDMQRYYHQHHPASEIFAPKPVPYWQMLGRAIAKRHRVFLLLEGLIVLLLMLSYMAWKLRG